MAQGPLSGVKVVEFAGLGPAPFCGMLLSDLGADVVRIDRKDARPAQPHHVTHRPGNAHRVPRGTRWNRTIQVLAKQHVTSNKQYVAPPQADSMHRLDSQK